MKRTRLVLLVAAVPATLHALGCLIHETTHTLYLTPEGSVTWLALEKDVRSDSDNPQEARQEEEEFLEKARTGDQPAVSDLRRLDPDSLRTEILRDERPFIVLTEARFESAVSLAQAILDQEKLRGYAEIQTTDGRTSLIVRFYPPAEEETADADSDDPEAGDAALARLATTLERFKIILTRGRFIEGHGFYISDNRQEASPHVMTVKEDGEDDGALVYSLTWE